MVHELRGAFIFCVFASAINLPAVPNSQDQDEDFVVVNFVDHPKVTDSNASLSFSTLELHRTLRSGVNRETVNGPKNSTRSDPIELGECFGR